MTNQRNNKVGGKGKQGKDKPPKPRNVNVSLLCVACDQRHLTTLIPGINDITLICNRCAAVTKVVVKYDGFGNVTLLEGMIEKVENVDQ